MKKITFLFCVILLIGCSGIEYRSDTPEKKSLQPLAQNLIVKQAWSKSIGKGIDHADVRLLLSDKDNLLMACDVHGKVYVINQDTGKELWSTNLKTTISAGPTVGDNKIIVSSNAKVIALNVNNGSVIWNTEVTSEVLAAPSVKDSVVFVHTLDGGISALSSNDGRQLWRFILHTPSLVLRRSSTPIVTKDYVIAGFANGKLVAVNRIDGIASWSQDLSSPTGRSDIQRMIDISADPIVLDDVVYVVGYQGKLAAFALQTGQLLWEKEVSSYSGMAIHKNIIYVAATNGDILAVERDTGNILWIQPDLQGRQLSQPVIQKDLLVVGDDDGYIHWLSLKNGQLQGRYKFQGDGIEAPPIVKGDKLYVYGRNGKLAKLIVS